MKTNKKTIIFIIIFFFMFVLAGCNEGSKLSIGTEYIEKNMYVGEKIMLKTNASELETGETLLWESSDTAVAVVNENGLIEAIGVGNATIKVTLGEEECLVIINVFEKINFDDYSITINGPQTVLINEKITLRAFVEPSDQSQTVFWKSSDETIASVDQTGTITGLKPGVVTITVTSEINDEINEDIIVLVRTGDGIQDVIYNYIYQNNYIGSGQYDLSSLSEQIINLVDKVEDSIIGVSFYQNAILHDAGTGGIYFREQTSTGYKYLAFTNYHVIEDNDDLRVYLKDIDEYVTPTVIKTDEVNDMAILQFEHTKYYETLKFAQQGSLKVGDFVIAIGHPGGYDFYNTVTFGICSRDERVLDSGTTVYVQHDAAINPGNSGGPLFNIKGEIIGINTLKIVSSNTEGLGFSISLSEILKFLQLNNA